MKGKEHQPFLGVNPNMKRLLRNPHDAKRGTLGVACFFLSSSPSWRASRRLLRSEILLRRGEDANAQKIKFGTTIHAAFTEVFLFGPNLLCRQACRGH
jgi:hypothetical protein